MVVLMEDMGIPPTLDDGGLFYCLFSVLFGVDIQRCPAMGGAGG